MKKQKMLHVIWSENESATYYVDKDEYSKAHDSGNFITLKTFEGMYTFDKTSFAVFLDTGTHKKQVSNINWKFYNTPTPVTTIEEE